MEKDRVKFYSTSDLIYGYMANKSIEVMKELDDNIDAYTLNDIIELYNIDRYAENSLFPKNFPEEDKKFFDEVHRCKINKIIGDYVAKICDNNVESLTQDLYGQYDEDFWSIVAKYKIYNRISNETFKKLLSKFHLLVILAHKSLVNKFDNELTEEIIKNPNYVDILISKYLRKSKDRKIFLPTSLTHAKKEELVQKYIESDIAHINTLELLARMPCLFYLTFNYQTILEQRQ